MKTCLLCILLAVSVAVEARLPVTAIRQNNFLKISVPPPPEGHKYTEAWVTIEQQEYGDLESLSPNSWQISAKGSFGTFSVILCGPYSCRVLEGDWALNDSYPLKVRGIILMSAALTALALAVLFALTIKFVHVLEKRWLT